MKQAIDKALEIFLVALAALMTFNVLWQVASRFILSEPSSFTEELARYLLVWIALLGGAYVSGQQKHLAIDLLPSSLSGKPKLRLQLFIRGIIMVFALFVLVIGGGKMVYITSILGQTTAALQLPMAVVYAAVPLSGLLIVVYSLIQMGAILKEINNPPVTDAD